MIDIATREKAAALAEACDRISMEMERQEKTADETVWARLEEADREAQKAYSDFGHPVANMHDGSTLHCPVCKVPILEEDLEAKEDAIA